jgi:pyruvate formate lyase activating enzyme
LDFPDRISAIIWTIDCNFRCPFCYNSNLVFGKVQLITEEVVLSFLKTRKGLLEGLVISGGEPLMQKDIAEFCEKVKKIGFLIKIDTNGMYPDKLKELIDKKLIDYLAMDVKAPKNKYDTVSGVKTDIKKIQKSIDLIKNSEVAYEFRTTFIPEFLTKQDIIEIGKWLKSSKRFYLQQFKNISPLVSSELEKIQPYSKEELISTLEKVKPFFKECDIRGI